MILAEAIILSGLALYAKEQSVTTVYAKALIYSDFVFVCKVVDEGPIGHGSTTVQKSYKVSYPETLYCGLVGLDLQDEIWVHYDSSRYLDVPKSGFETSFHKGDSFIVFLEYVGKSEFGIQIVRADKIEKKEQICKTIQEHRTSRLR